MNMKTSMTPDDWASYIVENLDFLLKAGIPADELERFKWSFRQWAIDIAENETKLCLQLVEDVASKENPATKSETCKHLIDSLQKRLPERQCQPTKSI